MITPSIQSPEAVRNQAGHVASLILDAHGVIRQCSEGDEELFGYKRGELNSRHISTLLPQLANTELLEKGQINRRLHFRCHVGSHFKVISRNGGCVKGLLFLSLLGSVVNPQLRLTVFPV